MKFSLHQAFSKFVDRIPSIFLDKYVIALIAFVVWMVFFDKNRLTVQMQMSHEISQLEESKEYYLKQIEDAKKARADLNKNLEKYAREKYFLKQKDEDVFIIEKN